MISYFNLILLNSTGKRLHLNTITLSKKGLAIPLGLSHNKLELLFLKLYKLEIMVIIQLTIQELMLC